MVYSKCVSTQVLVVPAYACCFGPLLSQPTSSTGWPAGSQYRWCWQDICYFPILERPISITIVGAVDLRPAEHCRSEMITRTGRCYRAGADPHRRIAVLVWFRETLWRHDVSGLSTFGAIQNLTLRWSFIGVKVPPVAAGGENPKRNVLSPPLAGY